MTDDFDPTLRSRESWSGSDDRDEDAVIQDDSTSGMARTNLDDLVSPHDQPAEGGREQAEDLTGAETDEAMDRR